MESSAITIETQLESLARVLEQDAFAAGERTRRADYCLGPLPYSDLKDAGTSDWVSKNSHDEDVTRRLATSIDVETRGAEVLSSLCRSVQYYTLLHSDWIAVHATTLTRRPEGVRGEVGESDAAREYGVSGVASAGVLVSVGETTEP